MELEEIKRAGLFSWFMDVGNSALFETVITEFQDSIELINSIVFIKAHSFSETKGVFEKLCVRGERLTAEEKELFLNDRKDFDKPAGTYLRNNECIEMALTYGKNRKNLAPFKD